MAQKKLTGRCLCEKITYQVDLPASEPDPKVSIHPSPLYLDISKQQPSPLSLTPHQKDIETNIPIR